MNTIVLFLATLGPIGTRLPAPGTMGSLFGTLLFAILTFGLGWSANFTALVFIPLFLVGIPLCSRAEVLLDRNDPSQVIWDEFSVIPFIFLPLSSVLEQPVNHEVFIWILLGFILFRFFDIWKPWMIGSVQKLRGGLGIMMDDLLAAFAASLVLWGVKTFSLSFLS